MHLKIESCAEEEEGDEVNISESNPTQFELVLNLNYTSKEITMALVNFQFIVPDMVMVYGAEVPH